MVATATACSLALLQVAGVSSNVGGSLVGALASPLLLVLFLVTNESRKRGGTFGDWRFLPSQLTILVVAIAGWGAGVAHVWFVAKEITRWQAG